MLHALLPSDTQRTAKRFNASPHVPDGRVGVAATPVEPRRRTPYAIKPMAPAEPHSFTVSSIVPAPCERVWSRITTMEGVNHELAPFIYMTIPRTLAGFTITDAPLGTRAFRSLVLL